MKTSSASFSRRAFVASSAGALAASMANTSLGQSDAVAPAALDGIETAIATLCCDGFGDEDFRYAFEAIPKLGVRNVEFNCWYARNLTPAGLRSIRERCTERGLGPISIQASSFSGGGNHDVAREVGRLLWLIEACGELDCRIIKCTGAARGTKGGLESLAEVLQEVSLAAEEKGIRIVLENHHRNVLEFPEDYEFIFRRAESPAIGICFDMGHFARSGVDMPPLIADFAEKIYHIDVKDADAVGGKKFVRFGTGIVDCAGILRQCVDRGYRGYLVLELSLIDRETMLDDLRAGLRITREFET